MLFALVLLVTTPAGQVEAFTVDHGMTMEDCAPLSRRDVRSFAIGSVEFSFNAGAARLVCEAE